MKKIQFIPKQKTMIVPQASTSKRTIQFIPKTQQPKQQRPIKFNV